MRGLPPRNVDRVIFGGSKQRRDEKTARAVRAASRFQS